MATFEAQVEGLTGIAIDGSSSPTQNELTEYLKDGVRDVTNKFVASVPESIKDFLRESAEQTSNEFETGRAKIATVLRETGVDGDWRNCREVPANLQSRVVDSNSLHYASKFNPAYCILNKGKISVFPTPNSSANAFKVYYVNNNPVNGSGSSLVYSHDDIDYFPTDKIYLVVTYAAIKSLENALAAIGSIPTIQGGSDELTDVTSGTITSAETDYDEWFHVAGQFIEDEEDEELATLQIQKINSYLEAFKAQNQANISNQAHFQLRHAILSKQYNSAFGKKSEE